MEIKNVKLKNAAVNVEERTFTGYASIFGNIDQGNDIVHPGAFAKTIQERGDKIKVMYNHMNIIGKATKLEETQKGLYVEGYISNTKLGDDVLVLMGDAVIDEMSIGYEAVKWDIDEKDGDRVRNLRELKLYEFSPVDFAMNDQAMITGVKSLAKLRGHDITDEEITKAVALIDSMKTKEPETLNGENEFQSIIDSITEGKKWARQELYKIITGA